jgi:hypothetical protein
MRTQGERLAFAIKLGGYRTRADFANAIGVQAVTLRQQINRNSIPAEDADKYARRLRRFGVTTDWLLFGRGPMPGEKSRGDPHPETGTAPTVKVEHYIGAGDEIHLLPDASALDEIVAPPGFEDGAAGIIRGDSMRPAFDEGDIPVWRVKQPPPQRDLPRRAVVVEVADGRLFLKKMLPGSRKGRFHLISVNPVTAPLLDQEVTAFARIGWVKMVEG